jgi:hypothetical protein
MADTKHVGRIKGTNDKVAVVYRTIPQDHNSALVIRTAKLGEGDHDGLMRIIQSNEAQTANELYEASERAPLPDGLNALAKFFKQGNLEKVPTDQVEMIPNTQSIIQLDELNKIIATQKGVSIEKLAVSNAPKVNPNLEGVKPQDSKILTDEQIATRMRSDADRLFKEASKLRKEAEDLSPAKKKTS